MRPSYSPEGFPASSSSGSPDTPPSPNEPKKRKRKAKIGPDGKQQRNGKVVGILRQKYATLESKLDLSPTATASQMASDELAGSLMIHLIGCSKGLLSTPTSPPFVDLNRIHKRFRTKGARLKSNDPRQDVLLACLIALGARRSAHTAIAGRSSLEEDNLGLRRETTCRVLAQRAVDMATASKLLYDPSPEANEVVAVLRDVLFASFPRHPFGGDLAAHYARTYQSGGPSIDDGRPVNPGEEALSVLEFDAYVACLLKRAPKISKTELSLVYGWKAEHVVDALAKMRTQRVCVAGILRVAGRVANIHALRIVSQLQRLDIPSATRDLKRVRKMFSNAWDVTEPSESTILAGYQAVLAAQSLRKTPTRASLAGTCSIAHKQAGGVPIDTDSIPIGPHVGVVPLTIEACLLEEATRLCTGVEDPIAPQFTGTPAANHSQALLLSTLDLASTWVELVTEAATQHAAGSGPLSDIGLTWNDLATLRKSLKRSSEIFAQSSKQEDALANAFAAMSVGDQVPKAGATAMEMVNGALMEIETLS